ncbi:class I SAM-dependent methyltransferase [Persicitalea jodogahamensis]|uniref:Uncharacterized protein n=1 Tax=Persicitalea jodogahamensis TaxID=402147 RepID=A0A8J3D712_9BACT|nr:class I SAM-dependent methyltransferase [Persicitalea jodogahamensis]GHB83353.1 hypothetical protein GCM10007390_42950 [Persicitalea jodogahamensis]
MSEPKNLVDQNYWDESYRDIDFYIGNNSLTDWLYRNYFNQRNLQNKTVFEVGCYPGTYLVHFGKQNMEVNGIDLTTNMINLNKWLVEQKIKVNKIINDDFFQLNDHVKYDVVCSFGFIEHFKNYEEVILKHSSILNENGTLIMTTPNFRGFGQYILHRLFDKPNLKRHNLNAMNPDKWAKLLEDNGFKIIHKGYFGHYDMWFDSDVTGYKILLKEKFLKHIHPRLKKYVKSDSSFFSPFCGVIAEKQ